MILLTQCKREQLQRNEKSFIRKVTSAPESRCVLGYNWLIEDLIICRTNPQSLCVLGVDPTFNLGRFNVTVTTFRNLKVTYARRCGKDPGWSWSRDSFKHPLLDEVGKVSNCMLPHASDTFQMQGARFNCYNRQYRLFDLKLSIFVCFVCFILFILVSV